MAFLKNIGIKYSTLFYLQVAQIPPGAITCSGDTRSKAAETTTATATRRQDKDNLWIKRFSGISRKTPTYQ